MLDTFAGKQPARRQVLRLGAMATLSRNFQLDFIRPLLASHDVEVVLRSGNLRELLVQLEAFTVDVILSTEPVRADAERPLHNHLIAEYPVSLVATRNIKVTREKFPNNLRHAPLVVPGRASSMRAAFDAVLAEAGVKPHLAAEVDDMAMLRLLAREGVGIALVPPVVVRELITRSEVVHAMTLRKQSQPARSSGLKGAARPARRPPANPRRMRSPQKNRTNRHPVVEGLTAASGLRPDKILWSHSGPSPSR